MKSNLLLIAAALAATTANAQQAKLVNFANRFTAKSAPVTGMYCSTDNSFVGTPVVRRIQDTAANPNAFYKRPKGTFYLGWSDEGRGWSASIVVYPPMAPITFLNGSTNPAQTTWTINSTALNATTFPENVDANNNLTWQYQKTSIANGRISYSYPPVLVNGTDSFTIGDGISALTGDQGFGLTLTPLSEGFYYGGSGPAAFYGDRQVTATRKQIAFYQVYDKPIGTFVLNEIAAYAWCNGGDLKTVGKNLRAYVYNVTTSANGNKELGDSVLGTFTFVADSVKLSGDWGATGAKSGSTYAMLTFFPLVDDGLGGQMVQPLDLNDEYAILITGFSGKNVGFYFADAPAGYVKAETESSMEYDESVAPKARFLAQDTTTNALYDYSYNANYYPVLQLHGFQDYSFFLLDNIEDNGTKTSFTEYTAPTTGGIAVNDSSYACQLYTALPWQDADGNNNYEVSVDYNGETPWIDGLTATDNGTYTIDQVVSGNSVDQSKSFVNTGYWAENGENVVGFRAQALPAAKSGRHAFVTIKSIHGQVSNRIVVRQGNDNTTGIESAVVTENNAKKDNRIFNLAGQQVTKAYKGVVISNGKKYIQK